MNSPLDLNMLSITRQAGNEISDPPDLYAVTPPRRAAHGREADSLILYLSMTGNSPLSTEAHNQLLQRLAEKFYKTSGSLTAALRTVVDALNLFLLDRNLRSTSMGRQGIGQAIVAALRADTVYLTQCGNVHAFLITSQETQHLYEPQSSGRGLGLSRTTPMRFLQVKLAPDDFMVLSTVSSASWTETLLSHPQRLGIESLRLRLVETGGQDFNAIIVQAQAGSGKLRILKRREDAPGVRPAPVSTSPESSIPTERPPIDSPSIQPQEDKRLGLPSSSFSTLQPTIQQVEDKKLGVASPSIPPISAGSQPGEDRRPGIPPVPITSQAAAEDKRPEIPSTPSPSPETPEDKRLGLPSRPAASVTPPVSPVPTPGYTAPEIDRPPLRVSSQPLSSFETSTNQESLPYGEPGNERGSSSMPAFPEPDHQTARAPRRSSAGSNFGTALRLKLAAVGVAILNALRSALATIARGLLRLLKSLLPDADVMRIPPSAMIFIALAIPIILATVGGMVYLQRGRTKQHEIYYQQAVEDAAFAAGLSNPLEQRMAWLTVIGDLDKADNYTLSSRSQELRQQANDSLDALDATKRVKYQPAIVGGLDSTVRVTRMVATATDLYMLNAEQGTVLRAIMTGRGYEIDPNFQCGPTYGAIDVGPLIDIAELPPGAFENASLLGMDANGNLLYCVVGNQPYSAAMAPPNTGFGEPMAIALDRSDLYVLDPNVNAVWLYHNLEVSQQPRLFFGDEIPPMQDVIDLTAYNDDLYLLHADGHITKCTYSSLSESPTRCDEPYPYSDNRPGRVHGPVIEDTVFSQIYFLSFPERSMYFLDPQNQAVFYFSVLLNLQSQYQPKDSIAKGNATAFAISPNRTLFLAISNQVYYAAMP